MTTFAPGLSPRLPVGCLAPGSHAAETLTRHQQGAPFRDYQGRRHFLRVDRDLLSEEDGRFYLPIGIVHVEVRTNLVLIELPHEAETGANRLWVKQEQLDKPVEAFA